MNRVDDQSHTIVKKNRKSGHKLHHVTLKIKISIILRQLFYEIDGVIY